LDLGKVIAALAANAGELEEYQWSGRSFDNDPLPFIAIPTTAGTGSEVTRVAVIVDRNTKKGINSDKLYPVQTIVDPTLMVGLPPSLTASTGMDALSHAVEAFVGLNANMFTDAFALEAVRLISRSLVKACIDGSDLQAREDMALASTLAGIAMDQAGLGIVHSMAGPFCGIFHLPHGEANAVLLKYGMTFNLKAVPNKFASLAVALGCHRAGMGTQEAGEAAVEAVARIVSETGLKVNLQDYGLKAEDADMVADQTMKMFLLKNNPYQPSFEDCKHLYLEVLAGENVT
jgi:alcohol dehydrogenase